MVKESDIPITTIYNKAINTIKFNEKIKVQQPLPITSKIYENYRYMNGLSKSNVLHIHDGFTGLLLDNEYEDPDLSKYKLSHDRALRYRRPSRFGIRN